MEVRLRYCLRILTAAAILMASVEAHALQISLNTAVDLALKNDPRVKMARASVTKAEAVLSEARDVYIPNVGVKGGYGASTGVPLNVPIVFSLASDSLLFNFSQRDTVRAANDGLKAAQLAMLDTEQQTSADVADTYLSLDNAQKKHAAFSAQSQYADRLIAIVQARVDAGQDTHMELLKAQRTGAQVKLAALNNEDEIVTLREHLGRLVGLPSSQLTTVSESIPPLPAIDALPTLSTEGPGVQASFAAALSKQEQAFGESRYSYRPQVAFGANYSRITTTHTNYPLYYPGFAQQHSDNALSVGLEISIPIFDYEHNAHARETAAEAVRALAEAQNNQIQFLEGRSKLLRSLQEINARREIASLDNKIAQEQLDAILLQLNSSSSDASGTVMTPKDEQSARLQEQQRLVDLLLAKGDLDTAEIDLLRQDGELADWLKSRLSTSSTY